jgi:hypothetical protein
MNRERALKIVLVIAGLIFLFTLDDVSVAERMAMAADPAGIRTDDPWRVGYSRNFPTARGG